MRGYLKMPLADFEGFNQAATEWIQQTDPTCISWTSYIMDNDPLFCWARVENGYLDYLGDVIKAQVIESTEDAVAAGMVEE